MRLIRVLASGLFNDAEFNPCLGVRAELLPLKRLTLGRRVRSFR